QTCALPIFSSSHPSILHRLCKHALVPGVRGAAIAASGLADMPLRVFLPGLIVGSFLFLGLHFFLGYLGGSLFSIVGRVLPLSWIALLVLVLLLSIFAVWVIVRRHQKTTLPD